MRPVGKDVSSQMGFLAGFKQRHPRDLIPVAHLRCVGRYHDLERRIACGLEKDIFHSHPGRGSVSPGEGASKKAVSICQTEKHRWAYGLLGLPILIGRTAHKFLSSGAL